MKIASMMVPMFGLAALSVVACGSAPEVDSDAADVVASSDEIVGGTTTSAYSYVVAVGDANGAFCTGTVVSRRVVVTASHCVGGITRIYFGARADRPTGSAVVVEERAHPQYNPTTLANDVAVLALASDAPVQAAPLLRETLSNTATWIGPSYTFVGYGLSNGITETGFGSKRVVKMPIAAVGPARVGGTPGSIDATQLYYRTRGKNTCNGDSGGPAFATRKQVLTLAGVTSFGDVACTVDGVQQRTDGPAIAGFIQPFIDRIEGSNACKADGICTESCNVAGQVGDPDCQAAHCGADGICARACVTDPDCR